MLIFNFFYMVIIKNYKVKKLFNKFPEISGKIGINFRKFPEIFRGKFPEISELTTLVAPVSDGRTCRHTDCKADRIVRINAETTTTIPFNCCSISYRPKPEHLVLVNLLWAQHSRQSSTQKSCSFGPSHKVHGYELTVIWLYTVCWLTWAMYILCRSSLI